mgnify:CR=1 FL=1
MAYHRSQSPDSESYGSFETFHQAAPPAEPGWYWWACFPGCIPDGDPVGPFANEVDAISDTNEGS